ncbi:hypothetical protein JOF42_000515 [Microbacterium phyllosphaerae]|uniref:alpha-amylase n=1 Tax=Microbacterium phyllosphaerae TaxID=124798 RepID=A0ABS4WLE3_9MICO|nr:carboxypeptidase regulatory-like domain-containing protein [Microbacterium phyllosphaerae]MBP2377020.1 hypothetical protein [Microbacterium phyllosphaerae]
MRAARGGLLAGATVLVATLVGVIPAAAATTTSWASWQPLTGTSGAYTTTVEIAAQPAMTATMTSDSRSGQVGVISGSTNWLSQGTPVGAKYGTSLNEQYLNLRPKVDNATSPSTTTYSFASPTPASGWTFVLGDIDADSVRIQALGANGQALTEEQLGFQGGFNYCAPGLAGKPSCTGDAADVPTWDTATQTLTGNAAAADTSGAAAWFEPSVPITSLTFFFTRRAGFPVYQTWFASIARDISGTVTDQADGVLEGVALSLTDANGDIVGTTTTGAGGTYSFPGFVATGGYTVRVTPPDGKIAVGSTSQAVDLTTDDDVADFEVRNIVPVAVSGRVVDGEGNPVAGVTVTVDGTQTTTTDADGNYLFDEVAVGPHTVVVTPPPGFSTTDPTEPLVVPEDSEVPIILDDFVLVENPDLSGAVRANGTGVAGVVITASSGGDVVTAVTDASGAYRFPRLPSGEYEVTMTTPDGYTATGPVSRTEDLDATDVANVDFELARSGALAGVVRTEGGAPVSGVVITVGTDEGSQQLTTDADGSYGLDDLSPGTYTLTITAPSGSTIVGPSTLTVVVTAAGETFVDQDFTLAAAVVIPPDPTDPTDPTDPSTPPSTGGGQLPGTGLGPETFAWAAGGAAVLVLGVVLFLIARRRANRD